MADARRMLEWDIASTIAAYVAGAFGGENAPQPNDIHPYRQTPRTTQAKVPVRFLKGYFGLAD